MDDTFLDEQHTPSMFPEEYVQGANAAMLDTNEILRIGRLHTRVKELYDRIFGVESSGGPHPGTLYVEFDTLLFELLVQVDVVDQWCRFR